MGFNRKGVSSVFEPSPQTYSNFIIFFNVLKDMFFLPAFNKLEAELADEYALLCHQFLRVW